MHREELIRELDSVLRGYLSEQGVDLVELIFRYEGSGLVLRIVADKPEGGITLEECASLNSRIGSMLDERDMIPERYVLEVCSPGLDRPLTRKEDFARCLNRRMRLFLREAVGGKVEIEGVLREIRDDVLVLGTADGIVEVALGTIARGKQVIG
jgi:ribosome maturation factor RimP